MKIAHIDKTIYQPLYNHNLVIDLEIPVDVSYDDIELEKRCEELNLLITPEIKHGYQTIIDKYLKSDLPIYFIYQNNIIATNKIASYGEILSNDDYQLQADALQNIMAYNSGIIFGYLVAEQIIKHKDTSNLVEGIADILSISSSNIELINNIIHNETANILSLNNQVLDKEISPIKREGIKRLILHETNK